MQVKELIQKLRCMDEEHHILLEISCQCGHLKVECEIDNVQYSHGDCVISGEEV